MDEAGHRGFASGPDIGCRACDRTRRRQAPKKCGSQICRTLRQKLCVGRCCPVIMRSATMADNRDSTPARNAIMRAEGNNSTTLSKPKSGIEGQGSVLGRSPKRDWIVSTGRSATATMADVHATATIRPGNLGAARRNRTMRIIALRPIRAEAPETVERAAQRISIVAKNSAGTSDTDSPKRSLIWLVAMMIAMPMVKPLMTGSIVIC